MYPIVSVQTDSSFWDVFEARIIIQPAFAKQGQTCVTIEHGNEPNVDGDGRAIAEILAKPMGNENTRNTVAIYSTETSSATILQTTMP